MRNEPLSAPDAVIAASERLAPFGLATPLQPARTLVPHAHFKCENLQRTGSFKIRGALNKVLLLTSQQRERGVVTSSTGNHGLAVAEALRLTSGRGTVVVSSSASRYKIERLTKAGLEVVVSDGDPMVVAGWLAYDVMEWWVRAGSLAFPLARGPVGDRRSMSDD
jgi:threonine dehydratase